MRIEICSRGKASELAQEADTNTAVISITSTYDEQEDFAGSIPAEAVLHLQFNDLQEEYDEEGIPYGRPLPVQEDLTGLRDFVSGLTCERLLVHCWEGISRSAAVACAVYEYRGCTDELLTHQRFEPNALVYALACRELGIRRGNLRYDLVPGEPLRK